jgi:hypothetical protein
VVEREQVQFAVARLNMIAMIAVYACVYADTEFLGVPFWKWVEVSAASFSFRPRHTYVCSLLAANSFKAFGMAQTVQRSSASGKRKAPPPSDSDPPTPSSKKVKTATARKSTGGNAPKRNSGRQSQGCEHVSIFCYTPWMLTGVT